MQKQANSAEYFCYSTAFCCQSKGNFSKIQATQKPLQRHPTGESLLLLTSIGPMLTNRHASFLVRMSACGHQRVACASHFIDGAGIPVSVYL